MHTTVPAELIDRIRHDLDRAGYTVPAVAELWGEEAEAALHRSQRLSAVRRLRGAPSTPLVTLARLFVLGETVAREAAEAAFPASGLDALERSGLLGSAQLGSAQLGTDSPGDGDVDLRDGVRALIDLRPYSFIDARGAGSWWIASDLGEMVLGRALDEDHVLGIGGATTTLIGLMLPRPVGRALDIGTGCGVQAMHASRLADVVVATDISERALRFARFNAALNGIDGIEFRHGSMYEPVAGERFDLIVTNPPFVITPRTADVPAYEYRDGGLVGDGIVELVVRGAVEHLAPGGMLQMLGNWEYTAAEAGMDRLASWAVGVEHWVIERELQDPAEYAETWIRDGGTHEGTRAFDGLYDAWLDDFERRGVRRIGLGYVLLRRPSDDGPNRRVPLRRTERLHTALTSVPAGLGSHLSDALAGWDAQNTLDDDALRATRLRVAPDVTEERHYWPGAEDPTVMALRQGAGFGRAVPLDTGLAAFVGACDGELAVGVIVDALAELLDADAAALEGSLLPRVRELMADAILVIA
ncbi:DUF7059 domain-containing protein [Mycetocola reblochoni]|uniref:Similar to Methylase of polypeptide chain release factors n=1 Tax=Mycetocola reblochoni REB411 TaxID=1255698 RepID=A0A1R4JNP6_9MICO|nr:methyltransferase [Mycetocola reblochoni]SJN33584.1 similar to Methylase of polypeptide chain release factors [Mycetocola reblochoni REB411]